jgi:hypothetical protein
LIELARFSFFFFWCNSLSSDYSINLQFKIRTSKMKIKRIFLIGSCWFDWLAGVVSFWLENGIKSFVAMIINNWGTWCHARWHSNFQEIAFANSYWCLRRASYWGVMVKGDVLGSVISIWNRFCYQDIVILCTWWWVQSSCWVQSGYISVSRLRLIIGASGGWWGWIWFWLSDCWELKL